MPNVKERYFAGSVGGATLDVVKQYIQQQDTPN